jgi:hypothetical protein
MKNQIFPVVILIILISLIFYSGCTGTNQSSAPQSNVPQTTVPQMYVPTITTPQSQYQKNMETIKEIVEEYHQTHTYTLTDMYVCAQMAQDVWDMVETQGITAKIEVGNVSEKVLTIHDATHAWVLAEVTPDQWVALETTGGFLVCPDTNYCALNNPLYFYGWDFATPKDLQTYLSNPAGWGCPTGDIIGSDNLCHQACGANTYCTGNSACVNDQCVSNPYACSAGYILGSDNLCHMACGANTYCTGNSICVNGQCRGCNSGYIMGQDLLCHQECPSGSTTYCTRGFCGNDGKCHLI